MVIKVESILYNVMIMVFILYVFEGSFFKCLIECLNYDEKCVFNCILFGFLMNKNLKKVFYDIIFILNRVD